MAIYSIKIRLNKYPHSKKALYFCGLLILKLDFFILYWNNCTDRSHMGKQIICYISFILLLTSCNSLKPLSFTANRQVSSTANTTPPKTTEKKSIKFIDNISVSTSKQPEGETAQKNEKTYTAKSQSKEFNAEIKNRETSKSNKLETTSALQMKYAILLNTEVENVNNPELYKKIDEWYGTRYQYGGSTKQGIDCSAFMQVLFSSLYGFILPRTAKDQYKLSTKISRVEMREGDLLFFNTTGGVSHVGYYLQNNKFVHASTGGVTISDIFDPYYLRRFVGVGRIDTEKLANK